MRNVPIFFAENATNNNFHDFHNTIIIARVSRVNCQHADQRLDQNGPDDLLTAPVVRYRVHTNHVLRRYHDTEVPISTKYHLRALALDCVV